MQEINQQEIYWHSRRGMLELDLLLVPFATQVFESLSHQDRALYSELLEAEDQVLWSWLMGRAEPAQARLKPIIERILAHNQQRD